MTQIPAGSAEYFSPSHPDWLWGPLSILSNRRKLERISPSSAKRIEKYRQKEREVFCLTLRLLMSYIYIYIYMEHLFLMFLDHTQRRTTVDLSR